MFWWFHSLILSALLRYCFSFISSIFLCDPELHCWHLFLSRLFFPEIAALSNSFCSWRAFRVTSTCVGGKRALEYRCSIENAGWVAFFGAPKSNWNMSLLVQLWNYKFCVIYRIAWIVCKVSLVQTVQFGSNYRTYEGSDWTYPWLLNVANSSLLPTSYWLEYWVKRVKWMRE